MEARRCLRCYDAPCSRACPAHVDVPGFISRLVEDDLAGSYQVLVTANPLPAICGLVCPTQELCEGACVLSRLGQRPIQVGALQYHVAANARQDAQASDVASGHRVAVIGAGPSGLSCAVELRRLGHGVSVFDRAGAPGGLVDQVIPHWRLPHADVERELGRIRHIGIDFHFGGEIGPARAAELRQDYDAIYLATGLGKSASPTLPGADLPGAMPALGFLHAARRAMRGEGPAPATGECVVVMGGGNTALDAAAAAARLGASRVIVLYRRTLVEMPAWRSEYMQAASLGVEFRWLSTVSAIRAKDGKVGAVEVQPQRLVAAGADGRRGVEVDRSAPTYVLPCTTVFQAVGQLVDTDLAATLGLGTTAGGAIRIDRETGQTTHPGIFAGGDMINGGATVVEAVADGMRAARAVHAWLAGQGGR